MTENTKTKYTTPGSHNLHTPSREEFHRYFPNKLTIADFDTDHCKEGAQIYKVASALSRTYSMAKCNLSTSWRFTQ